MLISKNLFGIMSIKGGDCMIKIAICDDFEDVIIQISDFLLEYQELKNQKLDIKTFSSAEDLWKYLKSNYCDLILLDIELVQMNGIELGQLIRTELNNHTIKIVYISSKNSYDRQLFDVQPLNFLPKPVDKEKLFKMIDLTAKLISDKDRFFVFESKQGTFRVKLDDILYFESQGHNFRALATSGNYEFKSTLNEVMKQISDSDFIHVHRSYLINYNQTSVIKYDEITMTNGDKIPISRDKRKEVRKIITELERAKL